MKRWLLLLAVIAALCAFTSGQTPEHGVATEIHNGPTLPANAPPYSLFELVVSGQAPVLYLCDNPVVCEQSSDWIVASGVGGGGGTITGINTTTGSGLQGGGNTGTLNLSLTTACSSGQILAYVSSAWSCVNPATGTITGITAGTDLTGGGSSGNVTVNLDTTKVPQLNVSNTFSASQTINGNLTLSGNFLGTGSGPTIWYGNEWSGGTCNPALYSLGICMGVNSSGAFTVCVGSTCTVYGSGGTISYPLLAPAGSAAAPSYSFSSDSKSGTYNISEGDQQAITALTVVNGVSGTATVLSPVNTLSWASGQTFTFAGLPSSPVDLTALNGVPLVVTSVSTGNPTSTVTFAQTSSIASGTYPSSGIFSGAYGQVYGGGLAGHQWKTSRLQSTTSNPSQTGSFQGARRDAWKDRSGPIDMTGADIPLIRGGAQISPAHAPGGLLQVNGAATAGATSLSIAFSGTGSNWSAVTGDPLLIALLPADGASDPDFQFYQVNANTTVTANGNTTVNITPALKTNLAGGEVISPYAMKVQVGDATGVEIWGPVYVANLADGCLNIASGILGSTGSPCGSGGGAVSSVFGRSGVVVAASGDYTVSQVTGAAADSAVVHNTGNETIAGTKTFSSTISGSVSGNAGGLSANIAESQVANLTTDLAAKVPTSTTVNGHALSANVTVSASDLTTGTLPHAQLPTLLSGDIPNNAANTTGTAGGLKAGGTIASLSDGCLNIASNVVGSTGSPCGSGGGSVASVFGRTGTVVAANGDYTY